MDFNISKQSCDKIVELMKQGWEFFIHFADHSSDSNIKVPCYEVDFTRQLPSGLYDNHECGYSLNADEAIDIAYNNIKTGKRLNNASKS